MSANHLSDVVVSRRSRFHRRFLFELRVVPAPARRRSFTLGGILMGLGALAFVALVVQVATGTGLTALDPGVAEWFRQKRFAEGTVVMDTLATVFGPVFLPLIILVVLVVWFAVARHLWRPLLLASGTVFGVICVQITAHVVQRPRPPMEYMLLGADGTFSFPSGHVTGVSDFFLLLTYLLVSRRPSLPAWIGGFALSAAMIACQIVARLYLGYHWLTDTLASVALAVAILGAVITVDTWRTTRAAPATTTAEVR
ncbi:hypothetical protein B5808_17730 [Cnuibacter physcomitrellae]|uniref:Phosphatidic acid phosphatase type 2/haloperoxidase domain-containing protein n=1 Tax=Cnuibacter physcomitrellae TaxID=1619308 RepID=A0A1X9LRA5_9MICO|nr:phosphatase PAP2 family protein [Cnuibacter physcomitrellae]ARJ06858.1 hypothetical protein B5808_17730 [Cnuibacter physcomitrellae]